VVVCDCLVRGGELLWAPPHLGACLLKTSCRLRATALLISMLRSYCFLLGSPGPGNTKLCDDAQFFKKKKPKRTIHSNLYLLPLCNIARYESFSYANCFLVLDLAFFKNMAPFVIEIVPKLNLSVLMTEAFTVNITLVTILFRFVPL
jgi:hypothetical protein